MTPSCCPRRLARRRCWQPSRWPTGQERDRSHPICLARSRPETPDEVTLASYAERCRRASRSRRTVVLVGHSGRLVITEAPSRTEKVSTLVYLGLLLGEGECPRGIAQTQRASSRPHRSQLDGRRSPSTRLAVGVSTKTAHTRAAWAAAQLTAEPIGRETTTRNKRPVGILPAAMSLHQDRAIAPQSAGDDRQNRRGLVIE